MCRGQSVHVRAVVARCDFAHRQGSKLATFNTGQEEGALAVSIGGGCMRVRIPDARGSSGVLVGWGEKSCERGQGHHYRVAPRALVTQTTELQLAPAPIPYSI